jgi:uncharacterized protein (TIGR03083 family)
MSPQAVVGSTPGPDLVAAFAECWDSLISVGCALDEAQWAEPSLCPGWTCRDALIHLTSAEMGFADWTPSPEPPSDVISAAARTLRKQSGAEVLAAFEVATRRRLEQLGNMSDADLDRQGWTAAGPGAYRRYMEIRVFDTWAHEQDIRVPLGLSGHLEGRGPAMSLDEAHIAFGYLVGKRAGLPDGSSVQVSVTGPNARDLYAVVEGRARVVDLVADPACTVTTDFLTFMLLCCGRIEPDGPIGDGRLTLGGDVALAGQVARNLRFTI